MPFKEWADNMVPKAGIIVATIEVFNPDLTEEYIADVRARADQKFETVQRELGYLHR